MYMQVASAAPFLFDRTGSCKNKAVVGQFIIQSE